MSPRAPHAGRLERQAGRDMLLFTLPAVGLMLAAFAAPFALILEQSFSDLSGRLSTQAFQRILLRPMFARVALNTLEISLLATLAALLLAYPLAYYLSVQPPRRRALLTTLVLVPFWTSALVKSFAFVVILGHAGLINRLLGAFGLPPLTLLFNRFGVLVGMSNYLVCFMLFPILTNLLAQPPVLRRAAAIMGANGWQVFWRVTLPLSLPAVASGSLLVFILSLGFYVVPALLGGLHDLMLSNFVDFYTSEATDWPMASALAVLLTLVAGLAAWGLSSMPGGAGLIGKAEPQT